MRTISPFWISRSPTYNLWRDFDDLFQNFEQSYPRERSARANTHLSEEDDHYLLSMDMPGFKKDDIKIELSGKTLAVSAERQRGPKSEGQRYYSASFALPSSVDTEKVEVLYEDGVLDVYLPKTLVAKPRQIEVQSKRGGFFEKLISSKKSEENFEESH